LQAPTLIPFYRSPRKAAERCKSKRPGSSQKSKRRCMKGIYWL